MELTESYIKAIGSSKYLAKNRKLLTQAVVIMLAGLAILLFQVWMQGDYAGDYSYKMINGETVITSDISINTLTINGVVFENVTPETNNTPLAVLGIIGALLFAAGVIFMFYLMVAQYIAEEKFYNQWLKDRLSFKINKEGE